MFARVKKSGKYNYLQVENRKIKGRGKQHDIATMGRSDRLQANDLIETFLRSLSQFFEKALLVLSGKSDVVAHAEKIGPTLIFERLWQEGGSGGEAIGQKGNPRDHRPALNQMVVGVVV